MSGVYPDGVTDADIDGDPDEPWNDFFDEAETPEEVAHAFSLGFAWLRARDPHPVGEPIAVTVEIEVDDD